MSKLKQLDEIAESITKDNVCPELAAGATQLVFGVGNPDTDVVFIGEAPGKKEDEQGEPFVGAAGKFLTEMINHIGLDREDVYITNIVKYRPPDNRDPSPEEKQAFWPYLARQLHVIGPGLIVTLGRHSMEYFLPGKRISQIHGQPKRIRARHTPYTTRHAEESQHSAERPGVDAAQGSSEQQVEASWVILPLYHPAAALYNGGMRTTLTEDFARIPAIIDLIQQDNQDERITNE